MNDSGYPDQRFSGCVEDIHDSNKFSKPSMISLTSAHCPNAPFEAAFTRAEFAMVVVDEETIRELTERDVPGP